MKNKCCLILLLLISVVSMSANAQYAMFLKQGNITFEKKINAYAVLDEQIKSLGESNSWIQQYADSYKKTNPQFKTTKYNLAFKDDKTLYTPIEDDGTAKTDMTDWTNVAKDNIVFSNLTDDKSVTYKNIFGSKFLITDSTRKINWKITDELRTIAGFQCRRANAIIMDSIYVVAFYTTEILPSGGPESFNGLPGMILGVALPHQHITWFATKVSVNPPVTDAQMEAPEKGKPVNNKTYFAQIQSSVKDWGNQGQMIMQNAMY